ncbi:MAG TPA: carboxypeptidase regulatory-like domain-containing protein [Gemmatimonadaceae bacterium]|jgi:hypothetical protein
MKQTLVNAAAVLFATAISAAAQTGVVGGTVTRDSAGHTLGEVQVSIAALKLVAQTNFRGEFTFGGVPAGRYALVFRHIGFAPLTDSITVRVGASIDQEWMLTEVPVQLDSSVTSAKARPSNPNLIEFEERRKLGFGHFIDETALRKIEGARPLINYIAATIPGVSVYQPDPKGRPMDYYLGSARGHTHCPVMIYIDGAVYSGADTPDISKLSPDDYSAIEYYAGGATIPAKYNMTRDGCGVLLLWRRYN